jgi:hypothetical protein
MCVKRVAMYVCHVICCTIAPIKYITFLAKAVKTSVSDKSADKLCFFIELLRFPCNVLIVECIQAQTTHDLIQNYQASEMIIVLLSDFLIFQLLLLILLLLCS